MPDITTYQSAAISDLMKNIEQYKYNPSGIQRKIFECLDEVTNGEMEVVDPTNPFVFLLEASCVNTALAISENVTNLRKQYPKLAQTEDDLYHHMCDKDYINRFATPSFTVFTIAMSLSDILYKLVDDPEESCYKATIPRDTYFTIDGYTFTLQYPIDIKKFYNGVVQFSYDTKVSSPLQTLTTNIINYQVRRESDGTEWVLIDVPVYQFAIASSQHNLVKSSIFSKNIQFNDSFYYCRVFYRNNETQGKWVEMETTHTKQVFDYSVPTALLTVYQNQLNVNIPPIYLNSNRISGSLRVDIYTTKGELSADFSNYEINAFTMVPRAIDDKRDQTKYTNGLANINKFVMCSSMVSGGSNSITFEKLRERIINNSVGDRNIPITNVQASTYVEDAGFGFVRNIDVVTNRVFLATKKLSTPVTSSIVTPANIGINTFPTNLTSLKDNRTVVFNDKRITILSNTLFKNVCGKLEIVEDIDLDNLRRLTKTKLVEEINNNQYQYTPYYYVLDTSENEFKVRAADLDSASADMLSFISQNQTLQLVVNTKSYWFYKTETGYKLIIEVESGEFYKKLKDEEVAVQLAFYSNGETSLAYINGKLMRTNPTTKERMFEFDIETNHDINEDGRLCITNAKMYGNENIKTWVNMYEKFYIFHLTTSITNEFVPDQANSLIGNFMYENNFVAITHESLNLKLGEMLNNLWTRARSYVSGSAYKTYDTDLPAVYTEDVYKKDPLTGSMFTVNEDGEVVWELEHSAGDPVLDNNEEPVYVHKKGDIVYDENGDPVIDEDISISREVDLLVVDGKYFFTTEENFVKYRKEISETITSWINKDLSNIHDKLLEQTEIYFYPKTTLGLIRVTVNNAVDDYIDSEQSLEVDLYVNNAVFIDNDIRKQIESDTIRLLDSYISERTINLTTITTELKNHYQDSVIALDIRGFGGPKNYRLLNVSDDYNRLCLKKNLEIQDDGELMVKEAVNITFFNTEKVISE